MIADWTVDISPDSPSIDVPWEGWVDLRDQGHEDLRAQDVRRLAETTDYPALISLLLSANAGNLFTSKVDIFWVSRDEVDPEIAECGEDETRFGMGSYMDVVTEEFTNFSDFGHFESVARRVAADLGKMDLPAPISVEVVVRPARLFGQETFGWTLYAMGFGSSEAAARQLWATAASAVSDQLRRVVAAHSADFAGRMSPNPSASVGE